MLIITCGLVVFILYRIFGIDGNPVQSVLFNGMSVLTLICAASLTRIMLVAAKFEDLQQRQEAFVETQKFLMRCEKEFDIEFSDDEDGDEDKEKMKI